MPAILPRFEKLPERLLTDNTEFLISQEDFAFYDSQGTLWLAPKGTKCDGASIPQLFLSVIGDRYDPKYRAAALVHDAYCQDINQEGASYHTRPWRDVHQMFYDACLCRGASKTTAQLMYAAIWLRGPRWTEIRGSEAALPANRSFASQNSGFTTEAALEVADEPLTMVPEQHLDQTLAKCKTWIEEKDRTNEELEQWLARHEQTLRAEAAPE